MCKRLRYSSPEKDAHFLIQFILEKKRKSTFETINIRQWITMLTKMNSQKEIQNVSTAFVVMVIVYFTTDKVTTYNVL